MNTRVLAFLSAVAGDALTRHLGVILPALLSSLKGKLGAEDEAQVILALTSYCEFEPFVLSYKELTITPMCYLRFRSCAAVKQ